MFFNEVSFEDALLIHTAQLDRYGGRPGLQREHALRSALDRPNSGYYEDTMQAASALMESLIKNHPFNDGVKRTSIQTTVYFLLKNGVKLNNKVNNLKAFNKLKRLMDTGNCNRLTLESWLRDYIVSI